MSGTTDSTQPPKESGEENAMQGRYSSDQLEAAGRRVLLYLKALHIPVHTRYAIADKALERAEKSCASGGNVVAEAMQSLPELLQEYRRPAGQSAREAPAPDGAHAAKGVPLADIFSKELSYVQDMPILNRGNMVPVELERTGAFTFFFLLFIKLIFFPLRSPLRMYFLFFTFVAFAALYWWRYFNQ